MVLHSIRLAVLITLCTFNSLQANNDTEQWFKKSTITLTDMSEVPGMVLEPGTYVLKAEESPGSGKMVIQLLNQDETQILRAHRKRFKIQFLRHFLQVFTLIRISGDWWNEVFE